MLGLLVRAQISLPPVDYSGVEVNTEIPNVIVARDTSAPDPWLQDPANGALAMAGISAVAAAIVFVRTRNDEDSSLPILIAALTANAVFLVSIGLLWPSFLGSSIPLEMFEDLSSEDLRLFVLPAFIKSLLAGVVIGAASYVMVKPHYGVTGLRADK